MMTRRLLRRTITVLSTAAVIVGAATACSTDSDSPSTHTASPTSFVTPRGMADGLGSGVADGTFPRTVKHHAGETVISAAPTRVVVISTGQIDGLLTLGVVPVGSTAVEGSDMVPNYLTTKFSAEKAKLDAITNVGNRTAPNVEAIANLKPDLILVNSSGKDADKLYASLSAVAPTVVTKGTGLYWKQDFLLLADALGKTTQAEQILDQYQSAAAEFGASLATKPTVSFLRRNGDRMRVFGVASFPGSIAEDAGLPRPESQSFTDETSVDISAEQIDKADADWIFYAVQGGDNSQLTGLDLWPTLTAVAADQAVAVDDDPFYLNAGPTAAQTVLDQLTTSIK